MLDSGGTLWYDVSEHLLTWPARSSNRTKHRGTTGPPVRSGRPASSQPRPLCSPRRASTAPRLGRSRRPSALARRSEERRVGKECRYRWSPYHEKKKKEMESE